MSDNLLGYSNSGLSQSLNGISTISDGEGASISNGNALFLDTNTNTLTINNNMTIPLTSQINLYGCIYLPDYLLLITETMMNIMYTQNNNHEILITGMSYNLSTNTTTFSDNFSLTGSNISINGYLTILSASSKYQIKLIF